MNLALIGSPRSGNTWISSLLAEAAGMERFAAHNYLDFPSDLQNSIVQIHWRRDAGFRRFLSDNRFSVIALARHPLDVLLSVLHFIRFEPLTSQWLGGDAAIPDELSGKSPASDEFLDYALSPGAENLLAVTYEWWQDEQTLHVRYEDFVDDASGQICRILDRLQIADRGIMNAIANNPFEKWKSLSNHHGWQGRYGVWRDLVPDEFRSAIFDRFRHLFDYVGYSYDGPRLTKEQATENWQKLRVPGLREGRSWPEENG